MLVEDNTVTAFVRKDSHNVQARWREPTTGLVVRRSTRSVELPEEPPAHLSLEAAVKNFFARHKMRDNTRRGYNSSAERWKQFLGCHADVRQIVLGHIAQFVQSRFREGTGSPAIRQDLAFLSSLLTHAQLLPGGPDRNVARDYPRRQLPPPNQRERFLSRAEADRLLSKLPAGPKRGIVIAVLETGMRRGEVLPLAWREVISEERVIRLPGDRTKTGKPRLIPLSPTLTALLEQASRSTPWVFPNPETGRPYYDPQPWFPKACEEAGLGDFHFHDLRHTFASWWVQRSGSPRTLQEVLGHQSAQTTKRYSHLDAEHLRREFDRVWNT